MHKKLRLFKLILFAFLGSISLPAIAQPNCTNHANSNGNNTVTFNVQNTNANDILITDVSTSMYLGGGGTFSYELLYNTTANASSGSSWTQGTVGVGQNGWMSAGTATVTIPSHTSPQLVLTGLSVNIPAGATYGFALTSSNGTLAYQSLTAGAGVNTFSSNGVNLLTGDNISWGAVVLPATPGNYPRGWVGCLGWVSSVPCAGTPNVPVASGPAAACPSQNVVLTATGASVGTGITYQWEQYNTATSSWDPIANATTVTYTITGGITTATDYRLITVCANGGGSSTSNTVSVGIASFLNCYCTPGATNPYDHIENVTFAGINNTTAAGNANGYNDYTGTVAPAVVMQGNTYTASLLLYNGGTEYGGIWFDWDQSGTFDAAEFVNMGSGQNPTVLTQNIVVPLTAVPGTTRMRVRSRYASALTGTDACVGYSYGETEDYYVDVQAAVQCAGTPSATTATGPATVCANSNFTLNSSGYSSGLSITYQWEMYNIATSTWDPIANATNPFYTVTGGIAAATDFRMVTTCANGGGQDISNTVSVALSPFFQCYCGPATGTTLNQFPFNLLTNVTIPGTTLNNTTTTMGTAGYTLNYPTTTSTTANVTQGVQYTLDITHSGTGYYTAAWIDYDQSGTFDAAEHIALTTNGQAGTATFIVPLSAAPGQTGLRLRSYWTTLTSGQACATTYSYETEDYVITIDQALPCSGTPAAVTASGPAGACANANFNLAATGFTTGLNITYQWESYNTATSTWDPIANATNPTVTITGGIAAATDFRFVTTCANGGGQDVSNTVSVAINPFYLCYCGPATGITLNSVTGTNYITNVTVTPGTLNNTTTTTPSNSYNLFFPTTATNTTDLEQGVQYSISTSHLYTYYYTEAWIDYDQNGTFDASEYVQLTTGGGGSSLNASASFTVPMSATPGLTGMRVRLYWTTIGAGNACGTNYSYETEDYVVNITVAPPCSGVPAAVTASAPSGACAGANFNLTATGYTTGTGISYQWEEYNTATSTWDPIVNATNHTYTVTGGITTATDYRFVTTCSNGGGQDVSNTVSVAINSFYNCYCASNATQTADGEISNVTFGSLNNSSTCAVAAPGAGSMLNQYSNFTTLPATQVVAGTPVSFSVAANTCGGGYPGFVKIFIDYDQDGTFTGVGEEVYASANITYGAGVTVSGTVNIPATAAAGITGMRVILWETGTASAVTPCGTYGYGETEDYLLDIQAAIPCAGNPAVTTISGPSSACPGVTFSLTASGFTAAGGISYQWESYNTATSTWDPILNATNTSYTVTGGITSATDYRFVTTCINGGGQDISNTLSVSVAPPTQCYCTPTYTFGGSADFITNVVMGTLSNNTAAAGNPAPYYVDYTSQQPGTIAIPDLAQGLTYNLSITFGADPNQYHGVWIDFDQDGVFASTEFFTTNTNTAGNGTVIVPITIPATATLGNTRMRIRGGDDSQPSSTQACGATNSGYGQTEDYLINVITAPSCLPPTGITLSATTSSSTDIDWNAATGAVDYEYAVTNSSTPPASGTPSGGTSVTGATYSGASVYYVHVRTDCGSGNYSSWATTSFMPANNAGGATPLVVNGGCTGNPYSNVGATQAVGEPYPSCNDWSTGEHTVWFSFVAPASGAVRISTDHAPQGTLDDSKIALFSAVDPYDYNTFSIISCDEDGGTEGFGYNSVMFAAGLTGGQTYYVQVDGYDAGVVGTFCITVDEITTGMLATSGACEDLQIPVHANSSYNGWFPLLTDGSSAGDAKLVALLRNQTGAAGQDYEGSVTVHTGAVRQDAVGAYYLDRNMLINSTATGTTEIMLFMPNSEIADLATAMGASLTVGNLNVTKQTGTICADDFDAANGTESLLTQNSSGTNGTVSWLTVQTNSFSNFYVHAGINPLVAELGDIAATNVGSRNRVDWNTLTEQVGDYFEVERSVDGSLFTRIGTVNGKGRAASYSYWDNTPVSGVNYYRLKLMDVSGRFEYSQVVTATVKDGNVFSVEAYPNPVSEGVVTVRTYGAAGANAQVSVTDVTGKVIKVIALTGGTATIDMKGMAQGVYLLKYADDVQSQTIRINKQ